MQDCKCNKDEIIKAQEDRLRIIEIKTEVQETTISSIKDSVKDIKDSMKDIEDKIDSKFKSLEDKSRNNLIWQRGTLVSILLMLIAFLFEKFA